MAKGLFVTGTDTGVGKTVIAACIVLKLKEKGINAGVMKPVCTGDRSDVVLLRQAAGISDPDEQVNPLFLNLPLAPMVTAEREGKTINLKQIHYAYSQLAAKYEFLVVEGAGGAMVPITSDYYMKDLIREMSLPVIVVSSLRLGTINHTLLTLQCLKKEGVTVKGIIFNTPSPTPPGLAEETNPEIIRRLTSLPILGIVPHSPGLCSVKPTLMPDRLNTLAVSTDLDNLLANLI